MPKPTKPTAPPKALRSDPSTFPARAEGTVDFLFGTNLDYVDDSNTFIDERADAALAAALGGDLPAITGQSLKLLRVNAGETAAEFTNTVTDPVLNGTVTGTAKASTANAEAGTGVGLMDATLTKAAIDAQEQQIGVGQTWQDLTASRSPSTSYQNTSGKPISVWINTGGSTLRFVQVSDDNVNWIIVGIVVDNGSDKRNSFTIVPSNHYYRVNGETTLYSWQELR